MVARQREALETTALLKKVHTEMNLMGSDISSSEDELLTGGDNNYSPIDGNDLKNELHNEKEDDRMSLSSLSSNEKIEEVKPELSQPPLPLNAPPNTTSVVPPPPMAPPVPGIYATAQGHYPSVPHYPGKIEKHTKTMF